MEYVVASSSSWHEALLDELRIRTKKKIHFIDRKEDLTIERLSAFNPRYVFFPHWSYIIKPPVYDNFECVIFHMTDVPFGRGGSPLQNLISRGIYETKITALRCEQGLDAGPVYMKRPLSLYGTAQEIYMRAALVIEDMIATIIHEEPEPAPQSGDVVEFSRRTPEESDISGLLSLGKIFHKISMLEAEGNPRAFMETESFR
jgi:methionyl-tRNA formyltransferase